MFALFLAMSGPACAQSQPQPDKSLVALAKQIAADGNPSIIIVGDPEAVSSVEAFAKAKNWKTERFVPQQANVFFGKQPSEANVLDLLQKLADRAFGDARSGGVGLSGPGYAPPALPVPSN